MDHQTKLTIPTRIIVGLLISVAFLLCSGCNAEMQTTTIATPTSTSTTEKKSAQVTISTPTPSPEVDVSPTHTTTQSPPEIPAIPTDLLAQPYHYSTPSPSDLMDALQLLNDQMSYVHELYSEEDENLISFLNENNRWFTAALDQKLSLDYPLGFPDPTILTERKISSNWYPYYSQGYMENLSQIVLHEIEDGKLTLSDQAEFSGDSYKANSYVVELDRDSGSEWLVEIVWQELGFLTWLVLDQQDGSSYMELNSALPMDMQYGLGGSDIEALEDFTGDGLTDIIYVRSHYAMGTDWGYFYILQGEPSGFVLLDELFQSISGYLADSLMYEIGYPDGSSWLTLTLIQPNSINWDCSWDTFSIYNWPYGSTQSIIRNEDPPNSAECALAQAVYLMDTPDLSTSIQLLEQAIHYFDPNDPDQAAKALFARFRLSILYALNQQNFLARRQFNRFVEDYSGSLEFAQDDLRLLLYDDPINALKICNTVSLAHPDQLPELWTDYLNPTAAINAYPAWWELYPPAICPFREILMGMISPIHFDPSSSPEAQLIDAGIPYQLVASYPLSDSNDFAWFALIGVGRYDVAVYYPEGSSYSWHIPYRFDPFVDEPMVFMRDVTGDGIQEFAIYGRIENTYMCEDEEDAYDIFITTSVGSSYISFGDVQCVPKGDDLDFDSYLEDGDGDGMVDWIIDEVLDSTDYSMLTEERVGPLAWFSPSEIQSMFQSTEETDGVSEHMKMITEDPSGFREAFLLKMDELRMYDSMDRTTWQRIAYFIGLSYELESDYDEALSWYAKIIDDGHESVWRYLASLSFGVE